VSGYGRPTSGYYAGYSLLLTPAALVTHAATTFYRGVLLINAGLSIFAPILAYVLVRQTFKATERWVALIAAGLVAFAPLVFTFAGLSMSENALVPAVLAVAVLFARAARDGDVRFVGLAMAMAVFSYWVSPRGLLVVVAALIAVVILAWELRRFRWVLGTAALVAVVGMASGQLFENAVKGNRRIAGVTNRKSPLIPSLVDPSIWHKWLANALGRLSYIGVSSAGLTIIGLAVAAGWIISRDKTIDDPMRRVRRCVGVFVFAAPVLTLVISAGGIATRVNAAQIDLWYYGRYIDAVAMPALAVGAGWVLSTPSRIRVARAVVITGAVIALSAILVPVLDNSRPDESHFNRLNIIALIPIQQAFDHPTLTYQLLIGAAIALVLGLLIATRAWVFGLVTVAVFASAGLFIHARYIHPNSVASARQNALADAVQVLRAHGVSVDCIVVDHRSRTFMYWNEYNYRFLLASSRFEAIRGSGSEDVDCGPLVITSNLQYGDTRPDVRLVSIENDAPMQLWINLAQLTPDARDDLTRAGLFFSGSPCDRMPKDAYKAEFSASVSGVKKPLDLESLELDADVGHIGNGSPWLGSRASTGSSCGHVVVALTMTDDHGDVVYRNTIGLPRTLFPGQGVHVHAKVAADTGTVPTLHAGHTYKLYARLEQRGVRYVGSAQPVVLSLAP
jgi:hypothetical protein